MAKRVAVKIDRVHTAKLMLGDRVTIKVPEGAKEITLVIDREVIEFLRLMRRPGLVVPTSLAELCDVFFNGRQARA